MFAPPAQLHYELGVVIIATFPAHVRFLLFLMVVLLAFDVGIALAMRSEAIRTLFKETEDKRSIKYRG